MGINGVKNILDYVKSNQLEVIFDIDVLRETLTIINDCSTSIDYPIGVNICPVTAEKPGIADRILMEIDLAKVSHKYIIIEFNEGTDFSNDEVIRNAKRLRNKGIKVALDDFGVASANLSTLMENCIDILKIDKVFVDEKSDEIQRSQVVILSTIKALCDNLNLLHIVEGIETKEQLDKIQDMGYSVVQGYLYKKPFELDNKSLATC
jgi:EAL domain-containing protein (putative c-di-GMP-specific phosphodiesterase class I)